MSSAKPASTDCPPIRPRNRPVVARECGRRVLSEATVGAQGEELRRDVLPAEVDSPDEEGQDEMTAEDVQPRQILNTPVLPMQKQIDDHSVDHTLYRSWCDACVSGRGQEAPHRHVDIGRRKYP